MSHIAIGAYAIYSDKAGTAGRLNNYMRLHGSHVMPGHVAACFSSCTRCRPCPATPNQSQKDTTSNQHLIEAQQYTQACRILRFLLMILQMSWGETGLPITMDDIRHCPVRQT
jgi:hypothetical protein